MQASEIAPELPMEELVAYSRENHIAILQVFGSAVHGEISEESDIDLLVTFVTGAPIGLIEFARIRRELGDIVGREVDLVTPAGIKPRIKQEILRSAVEIYALD
jgi:predicted nucleotidyltransferase